MQKPKLLIVDDDESILSQMKWALNEAYEVYLAGNRRGAIELYRRELPPLVTLDLGLPPNPRDATEGLKTLVEILSVNPSVKVLAVSGNIERENALKAIDQGAYDFFTKPIMINELRVTLQRAFQLFKLEEEIRHFRKVPISDSGIIGESSAMKVLHLNIRKISMNNFPVLISGESGTGKELVARAIHQQSERSAHPFVAINCGAIPENLMESELFGHEKGSFTGAHAQRKGRIEYAEGGTLFLDEIGELGLGLQVKLLRFLQEKTIERVGGRASLKIDTRVLAATNRDLKHLISTGAFREDLYYRLSVVSLSVPPLRDREGDLLLLANAFLKRYANETGKRIRGVSQTASEAMASYSWPGNVRELENKMKRAVVMAETPFLTLEDLELGDQTEAPPLPRLKEARDKLERELVQSALTRFGGNITQAASALGISRQAFHDIVVKHQIRRKT
ncbi:MAG: PEP-CTERM-box response regulator transcription factor [Nitrospinota bacterium]